MVRAIFTKMATTWGLVPATFDIRLGPCWVDRYHRPCGKGYQRYSWSDGVRHLCLGGHVMMYRLFHLGGAPMPHGHHVHHLCQNRQCLSPNHLIARAASEHIGEHNRMRTKNAKEV